MGDLGVSCFSRGGTCARGLAFVSPLNAPFFPLKTNCSDNAHYTKLFLILILKFFQRGINFQRLQKCTSVASNNNNGYKFIDSRKKKHNPQNHLQG